MKSESDLQNIKNKAVDLLARREHSEFELRDKLASKGFNIDLVEQVVQSMLDAGYLSDARYTKMIIRNGFEKGQGPQKIRFKLQQKRVASTIMDEGFEEFDGDWFELARSTRDRKFKNSLNTTDRMAYYKEKSRQMRFLAGRGFTMDQIEYSFEASES